MRQISTFIAGMRRDSRGATAVEFAAIAPALLMVLLGVMDLGYNLYAATLLEGAIQNAARASTIEGAEGRTLSIDERVRDVVDDLVFDATIEINRRAYTNFSDVAQPEAFTDVDGDGRCNAGEPFEDANRNGGVDGTETNPAMADTDAGGVADGLELQGGTDPLSPGDDYVLRGGCGAVSAGPTGVWALAMFFLWRRRRG